MSDSLSQMIAAVERSLGAKAVVTDPSEIEPWLTDWRGRVHGEARAILAPKSTEEVAGIVALAAEHRVPLVPQGGNTGMAAGATPPPDGSALILSLRRMNRLRSISAENRLAVAEAGMILADLHERANDVGMRFPLTLGARGSATIGGLTSTNAGGTQVLRFGTMRALVAGVEAVLPDGSVHSGLSALKKDNRGYSLDQLLIGAEGTLGVVTAVALRLVPAVASRAVAWAGVDHSGRCAGPAALPRGAHQRRRRFRAGVAGFARVGAEAHPGHPRSARRRAPVACADRSDHRRSRYRHRRRAPALPSRGARKGLDRRRGDCRQ